MRKNSKKVLSIVFAAMICLAAIGCGNNSTATPETDSKSQKTATSETKAPAEEVTLNFWHNYSAESAENETLTNVLIPKFEEENPGIKVNAVSYEWADLQHVLILLGFLNSRSQTSLFRLIKR